MSKSRSEESSNGTIFAPVPLQAGLRNRAGQVQHRARVFAFPSSFGAVFRLGVVLALGTAAAGRAADRSGLYKAFPQSISPNGAYFLAWGDHSIPGPMTEVPFGQEKFEIGDDEENYLMNAADKTAILTIPDFHYFDGAEGHQNHNGLMIGWSPDSKAALAVYDGRWSYESIAWIVPAAKKSISIGQKLEAMYRRVLLATGRSSYRKDPDEFAVTFHEPVFLSPEVVVLQAWAQVPKSVDVPAFHYRMQIKVMVKGEGAQIELQHARPMKETEIPFPDDDKIEDELNKVYGKVRAHLSDAEKESLKAQQLVWLKQRDAISDDFQKLEFTRRRVLEFYTRLSAP